MTLRELYYASIEAIAFQGKHLVSMWQHKEDTKGKIVRLCNDSGPFGDIVAHREDGKKLIQYNAYEVLKWIYRTGEMIEIMEEDDGY